MNTGYSIHIGLNRVDPYQYKNWEGILGSCENDASAMAEIAKSQGFSEPKVLLSEAATRENFLQWMSETAKSAKASDFVFISFSGHGGSIPDEDGDEEDEWDETWCFYDGELVDDIIFRSLQDFGQGVRVLVISDSCHSGTIIKNDGILSSGNTIAHRRRVRAIKDQLQARIRLIASCQDHQQSYSGKQYSHFTKELLAVWNQGAFLGTYEEFHEEIVKRLPFFKQHPKHFILGPSDAVFDLGPPFRIL